MRKYIETIQKQGSRLTLSLCMLAAATAMSAQEVTAEDDAPVAPKRAKVVKKYPTVSLRGKVIDLATKTPLPGVQVKTLGNNNYTAMSDENGEFTIKVPKFATSLFVHSPEYLSQQVAINVDDTTSVIDIKMMSDKYKTMYEDATTYTASRKFKANSHSVTIDNDIENNLSADVRAITRSGAADAGSAMFIRGLNSLNANSMPLIVLDGIELDMQYDRPSLHDGQFLNILSNIAPSDIESVEVLKNATALYGSRGANGVILINTKRGHSMATRIDADIYAGVELIPTLPTMMNATQYRNYASELLGTMDDVRNASEPISFNFLNDNPDGYYYNIYHNNYDWTKEAYRNAVTQNYNINVQGGDDVGMYNLSLGYSSAQTTARKNDFDRMNVRFNTDIQVFSRLKTKFDLAISRTQNNVFDMSFGQDLTSAPITSPIALALIKSPLVTPYQYNKVIGGFSTLLSENDDIFSQLRNGEQYSLANPTAILENGSGDNKNKAENTLFSVRLAPTWEINKHLKATVDFYYSLNRNSQRYMRPYNGVPNFTLDEIGKVTSKVMSLQSKNNNIVANARIDWGNVYGGHKINVYGGFRYNSFAYDLTVLGTEYNAETNDKNPTLATSPYPTNTGTSDTWRQIQWYANADYNYQNRYFATVSLLMEANSRFGKNAGATMGGVSWAFFPSVQLGWVLTNEKWFPKTRGVNYLRINAGFDTSGNDGISNYAARTSFTSTRFLYTSIGAQLTNIGNDKIKWELTKKMNYGIQGNFLDNRLTFAFDYYVHWTSDLLTLKAFENPIGGINRYWTNGGSLKNEGYEVAVSVKPVVTKDWRLEIGASVGHYKNKITSLPDGDYTSSVYGDNNIITAVGQSAAMFYGYKTAGIFADDNAAKCNNGDYLVMKDNAGASHAFKAGDVHFLDLYNDGVIDEKDKTVIGDPNPDIYGNMFVNLGFKRLQLNFNFNYSLGNDIYNYQRSILNSGSTFYNQQISAVGRWTYEGQQNATMPRATFGDPMGNNRFSDRWIEDGSFLRLKTIQLSYEIPVPGSWSWLQGLKVWAEARNVFTVTKYLGSDPELSIGNGVLYQGIDAGNLASGRSFLFGVKINL